MTFNLNIIKKPEFTDAVTRQVKHGNGIELTVCIKKDDAFNAAFAEVAPYLNAEKALTKNRLKKENQGINANEAILFLIGEYCISSWNIEKDGKPLPVNGENLLLVLENAFDKDELLGFMTDLIEKFNESFIEFSQKVADIQKSHRPIPLAKTKTRINPKTP